MLGLCVGSFAYNGIDLLRIVRMTGDPRPMTVRESLSKGSGFFGSWVVLTDVKLDCSQRVSFTRTDDEDGWILEYVPGRGADKAGPVLIADEHRPQHWPSALCPGRPGDRYEGFLGRADGSTLNRISSTLGFPGPYDRETRVLDRTTTDDGWRALWLVLVSVVCAAFSAWMLRRETLLWYQTR